MNAMLWKTVVGLALMTSAMSAYAQGVQKIGFVNTERIYLETKDAQAINKNLEKEFGRRFKQLRELEQEGVALQKLLLSNKLSAEEQSKQQQRMASINQHYIELKTSVDEEFSLRRNEEFAAMQMKANQALVELAKTENYDVIVKDVVYVKSEFDITDQLIKIMNRQ